MLMGRRIAVTTPTLPLWGADEANEPALILQSAGAEVSQLPLFQYTPIHMSGDEVRALLSRARSSDYLLFSSARAVLTLRDHLTAAECDVREIGSAEVLSVGSTTTAMIEDRLMLRCAQAPKPGGVAGLKKIDVDLEGKRVLWLRGREARPETRTVLEERGATVEEAILYESHPIRENRDRLHELLRRRALDAVTFGSARGVEAAFADLPEEERRAQTEGVCLAVIGPATAKALEALGLRVEVISPMPEQSALAASLIQHLWAGREAQ
jgi:uroporphyrinogen-III synthase